MLFSHCIRAGTENTQQYSFISSPIFLFQTVGVEVSFKRKLNQTYQQTKNICEQALATFSPDLSEYLNANPETQIRTDPDLQICKRVRVLTM